jgi:SAM-dependent methyltransferase
MTACRSNDSTLAYYERHAAEYASTTTPISMLAFASRFAELLPSRASVLDVGCGSGRDLRAMSTFGLTCTGLDLSPLLASRAASYSGCPVIVGDMRSIPFGDATFMGVWASASLLHLPRDEIGCGLAECNRVLARGGVFFSSMKSGHGEGYDPQGRYYSYVTQEEWASLLRRGGFSPLTIEENSDSAAQSHPWITSFARNAG